MDAKKPETRQVPLGTNDTLPNLLLEKGLSMNASLKVAERKPGVHIAAISGNLDSNTSPDIEPRLIPATHVLTLGLRNLEYIGSAGVRVVFKARKIIEGHGRKFIPTNLQPEVRKVFEIINVLPKKNIFTSTGEVDEYLDLMQKRVRFEGNKAKKTSEQTGGSTYSTPQTRRKR